jgi:hypothetical protein
MSMNTMMTAAEQAAEVERALKSETILAEIQRHEAVVSEIPLGPHDGSFGIVMNLYIAPEAVARSTLWALTVPLIRRLSDSGKLSEFEVVEVRVMTTVDGKSSERVLSLRSTVKDIRELPAKEEADLFRDIWDGERFDCYWYRDKKNIPA